MGAVLKSKIDIYESLYKKKPLESNYYISTNSSEKSYLNSDLNYYYNYSFGYK